jgi:ADP-ribose pyrophosphatase YjhB (NUDIX family)
LNTITSVKGRDFACAPVALVAYLVNEREEILLLAHPRRGGAWEPVSGGLEEGETILDGVLREIGEELGAAVRARPLGSIHISTFRYDANITHMVAASYLLAYEGGAITPGDDMAGSAVRWWSLAELQANEASILVPPPEQQWLFGRAIELYRLWRESRVALQPPLRDPLPRG